MTTQKNFDSVILPTIYQASGGGALTIPSSVGADTFVLLAASQTLTTKTLTSPTINGTIATTGLTLPAVTLGGAVTGGGRNVTGLGNVSFGTYMYSTVDNAISYYRGGLLAAGGGGFMACYGVAHATSPGVLAFYTPNAAGTGDTTRLSFSGVIATSVATWSATIQVGLVLGGNMTVTGYSFVGALDSDTGFKKSGTQVLGAQGAAVADATDAASVILRLNELLARCRTHGIIAT